MNGQPEYYKHAKWIAFVLLIFGILGCSGEKKQYHFAPQNLAEGDLVFRRGNGTKTRMVLHADTAGIYSHVGIIVKTDSAWMVIHITPDERKKGETVDKIKLETPALFFAENRAQKGVVMRFCDSVQCSVAAAKYALQLYHRQIEFDHDYNLEDSTKMYCSEFVWRIYMQGGRDITQGRRSMVKNFPLFSGTYIFPSDIFKNKHLSIIYEF